jgi:hypothetical protein
MGSTFVIQTDNCIMTMMFVIARSHRCTSVYDEPKQAQRSLLEGDEVYGLATDKTFRNHER